VLIRHSVSTPRRLEDLLPPDLSASLDRLDVLSRKILAGKLPGERRSKRRGRSVEFDDFRDYSPGDDIRHIDWNAYARLDRLLVKLFRAEEDLVLTLVLDESASMHAGDPPKLLFGARLIAALAYLGMANQNRVSVAAFGSSSGFRRLAPLRGRSGIRRVADFLLRPAQPAQGTAPDPGALFAEAMRQVTLRAPPRGVLVLVSDFLYDAAPGLRCLTGAVAGGMLDAFAVQVLSPGELDPARESEQGLVGDLRLTDVETARVAEVTITPQAMIHYRRGLGVHNQTLRRDCLRHGVGHVLVASNASVRDLVTATLRRAGLLG
jgi:uncharacterized protein (DUF58 family)